MDEVEIQKRGESWLETFFKLAAVPARVTVDELQNHDDGSCWVTMDASDLSPDQIQLLIGPQGAVLDSVQYLVNSTLNIGQPKDMQFAYTVELDGYRAKRQKELQAMADEAVQHVRETGQEFELATLSSAERRLVHTLLKPFEDVETYSRGQEPDRRLVVRPIDPSSERDSV